MAMNIEKELEKVHKSNSAAGFQLVTMLATRKLNIKRIEIAAEMSRIAADQMDDLLKRLKESK